MWHRRCVSQPTHFAHVSSFMWMLIRFRFFGHRSRRVNFFYSFFLQFLRNFEASTANELAIFESCGFQRVRCFKSIWHLTHNPWKKDFYPFLVFLTRNSIEFTSPWVKTPLMGHIRAFPGHIVYISFNINLSQNPNLTLNLTRRCSGFVYPRKSLYITLKR